MARVMGSAPPSRNLIGHVVEGENPWAGEINLIRQKRHPGIEINVEDDAESKNIQAGDFLRFIGQLTSNNASAASGTTGAIIFHTTDQANGIIPIPPGGWSANVSCTSPAAQTSLSTVRYGRRQTSRRRAASGLQPHHRPGTGIAADASSVHANRRIDRQFLQPTHVSFANVSLNAGDVVELLLTQDSSFPFGDFVGIDMTVTTVPEPMSLRMLALGGFVLVARRRK